MWMCVKNSMCQSKPLFLMGPELEWGIIKRAGCAAKGQSHKRLWWVSFFPLFFVFFSSFLNSAVTYQSLENNQVAGGMQGGVEDLSVKSAENAGLTASRQTEIKVKQRSSVTQTFFFLLLYISSFKEKVHDYISTGTYFLYLLEEISLL